MNSRALSIGRVLLLAGGYGTRLHPITLSIPKCLVPIGHQSLLEHWFDLMFSAGASSVLVNTHYLPGPINEVCHRSPYAARIELVHEEQLLGTAGTLRANRAHFESGSFWLIHADNFSRFDPQAMWEAHQSRPTGCLGTMMTFMTDQPSTCGIVALSSRGVVTDFFEKVENPPSNLANGAVFLLEPEIFSILDQHPNASDFCAGIVPSLIGRLFTFHNAQYHRDIGSPESYRIACKDFEQWTQNASL